MVNILSIDFDYFIKATAVEREELFPDGSDEVPKEVLNKLWEESYKTNPKIRGIDVIDEYCYVIELLQAYDISEDNIFIADTHKDIKILLDRIHKDESIRVVNMDFHHDYYHYFTGGEDYNCGNWLRRLVEDRPDTLVKWIRREDSQINSLEGEFPYENSTDVKEISKEKFDYIFICKSPEWTPPHLDNKFNQLLQEMCK